MILVIVSRDPDELFAAREQQDLVATLAAFGLPITLVFSDAGTRQLMPSRYPDNNLLHMLPGLGVERIYAEAYTETNDLSPDDAAISFQRITPSELRALTRSAHLAINI